MSVDASDLGPALRALERVDDELAPIAEDVVTAMADAVQASVRSAARPHRRTGKLEANIRKVDARRAGLHTSVTVRATGTVAPIIIGGQRAHDIRPRRARALKLGPGMTEAFAAGVHHPGVRADPFFSRGAAAANLDPILDRGADRAAHDVAAAMEG